MPTVAPKIEMPPIGYSNYRNRAAGQPHVNGREVLTERERKLKEIAVLTQYMEDLKAGRPVDNISPSNDPYFLVPENIAPMITGLYDMLAGKGRVVNSIKDIIGEWDI